MGKQKGKRQNRRKNRKKKETCRSRCQFECSFLVIIGSSYKLIKYVVVSLIRRLLNNSCGFQQIILNLCSDDFSARTERHTDEFPKTRRVVISHCFGVSESFQNWICGQDTCGKIFQKVSTFQILTYHRYFRSPPSEILK